MIKIGLVRIEGFYSYAKPVVFKFDTTGLFCIQGSNGCFMGGTPVRTSKGLVPIQDIKVGDLVLSVNLETEEAQLKPVFNTFKYSGITLKKNYVIFTMHSGKIVCTENHEFYYEGTWVEAGQLAQRIMASGTGIRGQVLCEQYGEIIDNAPSCQVDCEDSPPCDNETGPRCAGVSKNNAEDTGENKNCESTPYSSFSVVGKPEQFAGSESQRLCEIKQQDFQSGMGNAGGQFKALLGSKTPDCKEGGGLWEQQIDGAAGTGNKINDKDKQKFLCGDILSPTEKKRKFFKSEFREGKLSQEGYSSEVRGFRSNNKEYSNGGDLEACEIDLEDVISVEIVPAYDYVYDLSIADNNNYCITNDNILVHNSGKTTIFNALYWSLYKKTMNDQPADEIPTLKKYRTAEWKGTRVITEFSIGEVKYLVARHVKYKGTTLGLQGDDSLMVFTKTGEEKWDGSHMVGDELYKKDQQAYINRLLGISHKIFINSIVFGQRMARLISADPSEKRLLFEQLFDIDFVDKAKEKAEAKKAELEKELGLKDAKLDYLMSSRSDKEDNLVTQQNLLEQFEENRTKVVEGYRASFMQYKERKDTLVARQAEITEILAKAAKKKKAKGPAVDLPALYQDAEDKKETWEGYKDLAKGYSVHVMQTDQIINKLENEVVKLAKDLREIRDTCTVCGQKLKPGDLLQARKNIEIQIEQREKEVLEQQINRGKIVKALKESETNRDAAKPEFDAAYEAYEDAKAANRPEPIPDEERELERIKAQLPLIQESMNTVKAAADNEKAKQPPEVDLQSLQNDLTELDNQIKEFGEAKQNLLKDIDRCTWWITKAFGAKGIKAYAFSAMLTKLNEFAANYSVYFNVGVKFWVDLSKASKPFVTSIIRDGEDVSYNSLSGGYKQRVDLCFAFAMHDLVSYNNPFSIICLDECFEGLDAEGMAMAQEVIEDKARQKAVYLITHSLLFHVSASKTFEISGGLTGASAISN